nr:hypothetical protein [uncultured Anaerotignum sp.]
MHRRQKSMKKKAAGLAMVLLICQLFAGCGNAENENADTSDWLTAEGKRVLEEERANLKERDAVIGAVFLDYTADYTYPGRQEQREQAFPYLKGLPKERIVEQEGSEWFVILPVDEGWTITIEACKWNEDLTEATAEKELWKGTDGLPVILRCDGNDLHANACVTATKGEQKISWYPGYNVYTGEIERTEGVGQLAIGEGMLRDGCLYGMEGSWYCDSLQAEENQQIFYTILFLTDFKGNPSDLCFYGGYLNDGREDICFYWDGTYVSRSKTERITDNQEFEFWLNTPDGIKNGIMRLKKTGDRLIVQEIEGDDFFPMTKEAETEFYFKAQQEEGTYPLEEAGMAEQ